MAGDVGGSPFGLLKTPIELSSAGNALGFPLPCRRMRDGAPNLIQHGYDKDVRASFRTPWQLDEGGHDSRERAQCHTNVSDFVGRELQTLEQLRSKLRGPWFLTQGVRN